MAVGAAELAPGTGPDHHLGRRLPGRVHGQLLQRGAEQPGHGIFSRHTVLAASHALDLARDNITDCVNLRAAQGTDLKRWLQTEAPDARQSYLGRPGL